MNEDLARLIAAESILTAGMLHRTLHVILALILWWMAYIFLDSTPTFVPEAHVYDFMKEVMPERCWGFSTFFIGSIGLATSYWSGWKLRSLGAAVLAFAHAALALCFCLGKPNVPSVGLLVACAFMGAVLSYSTSYIGQRFKKRVDPSGPFRPLAR